MNRIGSLGWLLVLTALLLFVPVVLPSFSLVNNLTEILIMALFGVSLNLLVSYTGLLSLGHCAFFAIGSYATGLLLRDVAAMPVPLALLIGMLLSAVFALLMGYLCTRLTSFYFSFLTLGLSQVIYVLVVRWSSLTGGDQGLVGGIPKPPLHLFGWVFDISSRLNFYYFTVLLVCASLIICKAITDSPFGWVLRAIRDNPLRAQFNGVNIRKYQIIVFCMAGFFAALSGGLTALNINGCYTDHANWLRGADPVFMILIGGMLNFAGPMVGAAVMVFLDTVISMYTRYLTFFVGAIMIFIVVYARMGVLDFCILKGRELSRLTTWGKRREALKESAGEG